MPETAPRVDSVPTPITERAADAVIVAASAAFVSAAAPIASEPVAVYPISRQFAPSDSLPPVDQQLHQHQGNPCF